MSLGVTQQILISSPVVKFMHSNELQMKLKSLTQDLKIAYFLPFLTGPKELKVFAGQVTVSIHTYRFLNFVRF